MQFFQVRIYIISLKSAIYQNFSTVLFRLIRIVSIFKFGYLFLNLFFILVKELSYLHAEGYPAGEMKHGPLALIEEGLPVIVIAPNDRYYEKTLSNTQEVIARGGKIFFITDNKKRLLSTNIRFRLRVPRGDNLLSPLLFTIPLQLLAYHVALLKNCDIDKPRNLAKSVTVE